MNGLLLDLRHALRHLARSRAFFAVATLTLGLGIGANTAIFTMLNALVWQQLPIASPTGLIGMTSRDDRGRERYIPFPAVKELQRTGPFEEVCGYNGGANIGVLVNGAPAQTVAAFVSGRCFETFGVRPILGRAINDDDAPLMVAGNRVVVISHAFWTRHFAANPSAIGQTIRADSVEATIVGVLPKGFGGLQIDTAIEIFAPPDTLIPARGDRRPVATHFLGRLRPGRTLEQAQAEVTTGWPALLKASTPGSTNAQEGADLWGSVVVLERMGAGLSNFRSRYASSLTMTLGLTGLLLALACLNLTGLSLTRLAARHDEIAIRQALGGGVGRFARQLVLESLLIAVPGAVLAVFMASLLTAAMQSFMPAGNAPPTISFAPTIRSFVLTGGVALAVTFILTVLPTWLVARAPAAIRMGSSRSIAGTSSKWAELLLVPQVALSIVMLVGALVLVRSVFELSRTDLGVQTSGVLAARLQPVPGSGQSPAPGNYFLKLLEDVSSIPGVRSAGFSQIFPRMLLSPQTVVTFQGDPPGDIRALADVASPEFFATVGVPVLSGRIYTWSESSAGHPVALVSRSLAYALEPGGGNVIDRKINFGTVRSRQGVTIIGVVGDASMGNPRLAKVPLVFFPPAPGTVSSPNLLVATSGDAASAASGIRGVLHNGGRHYAQDVAELDAIFSRAPSNERMTATLAGTIAILAVTIAIVGLHGTLVYGVVRRRREIGVRLALGATPRSVAYQVQRHALRLTLLGVALGIPASWFAVRLLQSVVYGVSVHDPLHYVGAVLAMCVLSAAGAWMPAARASRVDPIVALRSE
jgi:predicted permease